MKTLSTLITALAVCLLVNDTASAETVHQTVPGEAAMTAGGAKALDKKQIEVKNLPEVGNVARVVGTMSQWGFVNFWFGLPAPAGKVIVRFKIYVEDGETASYAAYIKKEGSEPLVHKLQIPADAPKNTVVTVDIPVDLPNEWNGLALKKIVASDKPSAWIQSVSIVVP
jgi:hypothetical protein